MREKSVFTTFEAAKLCHVSPLSIINWVNAGRLPAFRTPWGHRRIRREDLVRFMRENGIPIPEELRDGSGRSRVLVVDDERGIREVKPLENIQKMAPDIADEVITTLQDQVTGVTGPSRKVLADMQAQQR